MAKRKQKSFDHVPQVTREHGSAFADALFERWTDAGVVFEAISATKVMTYPSDDDAPGEFMDAQDAIVDSLEVEIREAIGRAFRKAASRALNVPAAE